MAITLLTGPVASGKSRLAADLAGRWPGPVDLVVTAQGLDEEMRARIERHRAERPESWRVHEEPLDLRGAIGSLPTDAFAIVDCLTLWVSNRLGAGDGPDQVADLARDAAEAAAARRAPTVVVTNEVGWGIVPVNDLARAYRDLLGRVNVAFADRAGAAWLVVAGRAVVLPAADHGELLA
jgi:adenosyl cobinamide kinase/adenosyl cobinamide phosphate guanylyltransferase